MRAAALLVVLALTPRADAVAQDPPPLEAGTLVRVTIPALSMNKRQAVFEALRGDSIVLSGWASSLAYVTRLEVHAGQRSHMALGMSLGGATSVVGILLLHSFLCEMRRVDGENLCSSSTPPARGVVAAGTAGVLIGAVIGGVLMKTDRWQEVPLDRVRLSVMPQRHDGLGLGVSVRF